MPTILRELGFQFYFFANEHLPRHIHIQKNEDYARFDLERLKFTECTFKGKDLRSLKNIINEHQDYFRTPIQVISATVRVTGDKG